jgi:hypothetical protein
MCQLSFFCSEFCVSLCSVCIFRGPVRVLLATVTSLSLSPPGSSGPPQTRIRAAGPPVISAVDCVGLFRQAPFESETPLGCLSGPVLPLSIASFPFLSSTSRCLHTFKSPVSRNHFRTTTWHHIHPATLLPSLPVTSPNPRVGCRQCFVLQADN